MSPKKGYLADLCAFAVCMWFSLNEDDRRLITARTLRAAAVILGVTARTAGSLALAAEHEAAQVIRP